MHHSIKTVAFLAALGWTTASLAASAAPHWEAVNPQVPRGETRSPRRAPHRDGWKADSWQGDRHPDAVGHGPRQYGRDDDRDAPSALVASRSHEF
jgi:hypothetical protein